MITFRTKLDTQNFLIECGRVDLLSDINEQYKPTQELYEEWIKARRDSINKMKDFRKSQDSKAMWRRNGRRIIRGLKGFHRSTKGKRFHRNLARFMASRESYKESYSPEHMAWKSEILNTLSSLKTQMYLHFEFYNPLLEDVDYVLFTEEVGPVIAEIEKKIIVNRFHQITEDEFALLYSLTSSDNLIEEYARIKGIPIAILEKKWCEAEIELIENKEYAAIECFGLNSDIVNYLWGTDGKD